VRTSIGTSKLGQLAPKGDRGNRSPLVAKHSPIVLLRTRGLALGNRSTGRNWPFSERRSRSAITIDILRHRSYLQTSGNVFANPLAISKFSGPVYPARRSEKLPAGQRSETAMALRKTTRGRTLRKWQLKSKPMPPVPPSAAPSRPTISVSCRKESKTRKLGSFRKIPKRTRSVPHEPCSAIGQDRVRAFAQRHFRIDHASLAVPSAATVKFFSPPDRGSGCHRLRSPRGSSR